MTVPVPYALPVTSSWGLVDWVDDTYTGIAGADGVATITLSPLQDTQRWQLTHMVAGCNSSAVTSMRLYLDQVANTTLRDGTSSGNFDVADWPSGLMVPPSRTLIARWTGCNPGDQVFLTLQANVLQRRS